jgi:glutaredoxin-like protein
MERLLPEDVASQIKELLAKMVNDVTVVYFTDNVSLYTAETEEFLKEIAELNSKIHLEVKDVIKDKDEVAKYEIKLVPSTVLLDKDGNYSRIKFNGIPAGHEINSFLAALLEVSGIKSQMLSDENLKKIQNIDKSVDIKIFVTLSCPHCPGAVQNANRIALNNKNVKAQMIEANTFGDLSQKYGVESVPKIVINDKVEFVGDQPIEKFLEAISRA